MGLFSDELRDRLVQLPIGKGLVEEAVRSLLHRLHGRGLVRERRDHQDAHRRLQLHQLGDAFNAIHLRHCQIHGDHIRVVLPEQLQCLQAIAGSPHELDLIELLRAFDAPAHDVRVIDDHELQGSGHVGSLSFTGALQATALASSAAGRTILKRVNFPGLVLTPILPPSAYTLRATTSMPTPRPASMETPSCVEKPGRKISAMAARMSIPAASSGVMICLRTAAALSCSGEIPAPSSSNTSS